VAIEWYEPQPDAKQPCPECKSDDCLITAMCGNRGETYDYGDGERTPVLSYWNLRKCKGCGNVWE
jgi:hypothetical protein